MGRTLLALVAASSIWAAPAAAQLRPLVTPDDYPPGSLARHEQGTVFFHLTIDTDGRVKACQITRSSGYSDLDATTCRIMASRAHFKPKRGKNGQPVEYTFDSKVDWSLD
jgi:protein TonB